MYMYVKVRINWLPLWRLNVQYLGSCPPQNPQVSAQEIRPVATSNPDLHVCMYMYVYVHMYVCTCMYVKVRINR